MCASFFCLFNSYSTLNDSCDVMHGGCVGGGLAGWRRGVEQKHARPPHPPTPLAETWLEGVGCDIALTLNASQGAHTHIVGMGCPPSILLARAPWDCHVKASLNLRWEVVSQAHSTCKAMYVHQLQSVRLSCATCATYVSRIQALDTSFHDNIRRLVHHKNNGDSWLRIRGSWPEEEGRE